MRFIVIDTSHKRERNNKEKNYIYIYISILIKNSLYILDN